MMHNGPPVKPIEWLEDRVRIIDQRCLPERECFMDLRDAGAVAEAIRDMALRGAPLIGIAAAMGVAVESRRWAGSTRRELDLRLEDAIEVLRSTRPTASNLFWALERMRRALVGCAAGASARECSDALVGEALRIYEEDLATGLAMGRTGAGLIADGSTVLTHCNAGALATSGYGTALSPLYVALRMGLSFKVFADETRPLFQGARLTAWELTRAGIDVTVICDSASHLVLSRGMVDLVLVGADRIASNGDFANKIGTLGVARSARAAGVPFYVVAPTSTVDTSLERGDLIPIEERDPCEVTTIAGKPITPPGVAAYNPAFDVTPSELVTGFITEKGLVSPPFGPHAEGPGPAGQAPQRR
jgi:methylthioribose-1-phosphate isomerase